MASSPVARLESRLKTLQRQIEKLETEAKKARGQARVRLRRLERRTRVTVGRALQKAEPQVRKAVAEATRLGRGLRAGIRAGAAAYRAGRPPKA
ncbi:MAG: hypothetical protein HY727_10695 [Candidatus Rokubacteria bacterium]|nr:hypothetical protein [Candidatus Rokubacteria bacterium]